MIGDLIAAGVTWDLMQTLTVADAARVARRATPKGAAQDA